MNQEENKKKRKECLKDQKKEKERNQGNWMIKKKY